MTLGLGVSGGMGNMYMKINRETISIKLSRAL